MKGGGYLAYHAFAQLCATPGRSLGVTQRTSPTRRYGSPELERRWIEGKRTQAKYVLVTEARPRTARK